MADRSHSSRRIDRLFKRERGGFSSQDGGSLGELTPRFGRRDTSGFFLAGRLCGSAVTAFWDGETLTISEVLLSISELATAVDDVYVQAGLDTPGVSSAASGSPGWMLVALTGVCDELTCVEYQAREGHRKVL